MANVNKDGTLLEIERLKAEKEELEKRISLLEAQLSDEKSTTFISDGSGGEVNATASSDYGNGLTPDMIYRYSRHLLLPNFGVEGEKNLSILTLVFLILFALCIFTPLLLRCDNKGVVIIFLLHFDYGFGFVG